MRFFPLLFFPLEITLEEEGLAETVGVSEVFDALVLRVP